MKQELNLSNQICHRFYVATNAITRAYKPYLAELDVTYPQYVVLMALWELDDIEVGKLQQVTKIDSGALTQILKKLEQKKIVRLVPSDTDRRVKLVQLTKHGSELEQSAQSIPKKLRCQFPELSGEELMQLQELLDKLNASLLSAEEKV